jgi:hypothetical protein
MDAQTAAELREAKRAAAKVLREHGVHAQVVVDAGAPTSPHPGVRAFPLGIPSLRHRGFPGPGSPRCRRQRPPVPPAGTASSSRTQPVRPTTRG